MSTRSKLRQGVPGLPHSQKDKIPCIFHVLLAFSLLPPATKLGQGNIFRSVCQEFCPQGGGHACVAGGRVWWGACMAGGLGVCVAGGVGACVTGGRACVAYGQ